MFGIKFGSKKFLGVDIGTSSIRVIELSKKGKKLELRNYGEIDNSLIGAKSLDESKKDAFLSADNNIAKAIKSICKEAGIQTKEVNFSIPDFRSFFTSFKMPTMAKEELNEAIKYEVRPYIPLPLSEITLDWLVIEGEPAKTPLKVLVVAVPNEIINQYQAIAHLSGLKLKILESEVFALARALTEVKKSDVLLPKKSLAKKGKKGSVKGVERKKIIGLIDIGERTTTCSIAEGKVLKTSHSFTIAKNELTERLAKSLDIDYNESEELIGKYGLSDRNQEAQQNFRKVLTSLIDLLFQDIKESFRSFQQKESKEVEKIVLSGGFSLMPGLKEYFSSEFNKETVISNPFLDISYPEILKETLERKGPIYAIGVGLAMKGLE